MNAPIYQQKRTAPVVDLPMERLMRAWRIVEVQPGVFEGGLCQRAGGQLARTERGPIDLVRDAIDGLRDGLPVSYGRTGNERRPG